VTSAGASVAFAATAASQLTPLDSFGTLQPLRDEEPVEYGITRNVDTGSFWDVHFREFALLATDVRRAEPWGDKLRILLKPPGWQPGADSHTAASRKRSLAQSAKPIPPASSLVSE
jgi:hypothetical protein